jgi:Arc/MetJ family transcription regulator
MMRINVVIDEGLIEKAKKYSGLSTKKAVIEEALRFYVRLKAQEQLRDLRGKLKWEGDLDEMRQGRKDVGYVHPTDFMSTLNQESE